MLENAYELKMAVMRNKYDKIFEEFEFAKYNDDRMVAVNELNQILAACESMKSVDNAFVRTAVNQAIKAQDRKMESIVRRFTGRIYKGVQWVPADDVVCDEAPEITKEMIQKGLEQKVIVLAVDPNLFCGTVCAIGENWFYFGGMVAEESDAEEYLRNTPIEDIVNEIFTALDDFKTDEDSRTEYAYYAHYLKENLHEQDASEVIEEEAKEITKEMIEAGIDQSLINFEVDPIYGTVCRIGEHTFYFGGEESETLDPQDYIQNVPGEDLVDKVYGALEGFRKAPNFQTEYAYYFYFLVENLRKQEESKEQEVQAGITVDMFDREFAWLKGYAEQACLDEEPCGDIFRMLWTAYCYHANRIVDTEPYDRDIRVLWNVVSGSEAETADWSDFESFDQFMCKYLV